MYRLLDLLSQLSGPVLAELRANDLFPPVTGEALNEQVW